MIIIVVNCGFGVVKSVVVEDVLNVVEDIIVDDPVLGTVVVVNSSKIMFPPLHSSKRILLVKVSIIIYSQRSTFTI